MPVIDELLGANKQYAGSFDKGGLPMPPARQVAIVTCMDARLHPAEFLGWRSATPTSSATRVAGRPTTLSAR